MSKSFFYCNSLLWIKSETLFEQVDSQWLCVRVHFRILLLLLEWQSSKVVSRSVRVDLVEVIERGRAEHIEDERELMVIVPAGE